MFRSATMVGGIALAAFLASPLHAQIRERVQTGGYGDLQFEARSRIVGMTPTAGGSGPRFGGPGDPIFHASEYTARGTVPIVMNTGGGNFICSASVLPDRRSLLTAAHCVSDGAGTPNPTSTTAYFQQDLGPSDRSVSDGVATPIAVQEYIVHENYSGSVIDQYDIAILRLENEVPDWAISYDVNFSTGLRGQQFTVAGFGARSVDGGSMGLTPGSTGYLREGQNTFDFRFGDPIFDINGGNPWGDIVGPLDRTAYSYISDFDNGLAANDHSCRVTQDGSLLGAANATFCDTGLGAREVGVAGGDSGGPLFDDQGRLIALTSYALSFGTGFGDCREGLQSSCGEMSGFVPLYYHQNFIQANLQAMVPEPATAAMLLVGLAGLGAAAWRRRA